MTLFKIAKETGVKAKKMGATVAILTMATMMTLMGGSFADGGQIKPILPVNKPTAAATATASILPGGCYQLPSCKSVTLNGQILLLNESTKPYRADTGELMVPLKKYAQDLGMKVTWKAADKAVEVVSKDKKSLIPVGEGPSVTLGNVSYRAQVIEGKLYVSYRVFSEVMGCTAVETSDQGLVIDSAVQKLDEASTLGEIIEIIQGKDGVQILVKGNAEGQFGLDEISLAVTRSVPISRIKSDGTVMTVASSDLKKGDSVYVKYGKSVTRSMPALGQAISVDVLKDCSMMTGKIYDVQTPKDGKGLVSVHVIGRTDYVLHLDPKVILIDESGKALSASDLKTGQMVRATIAQFSTMSLPPQTTAYKIVVVK